MWLQLFLWIATTLLTDYFREALPNVTPSGLGDFTIPTATEGRFVPLAFGTTVIQGPNVTWYGDFEAVERTVTTGLIFRREETIGFTYFLGMQMGLIRGQTAGIKRIWVGDDVVWDYLIEGGGDIQQVCDINIDDLFGGKDGGGGWVGRVRLFDGSPTQGQSDYLKFERRKLSNNPNTSPQFETTLRQPNLPNYRGFSYVTLSNLAEQKVGGISGGLVTSTPAEVKGVNIGESNQMRHMKFEIQTFDTVANGGLGDVLGLGNDHHFIGEDLNPISLAYQVFTDTDWGRGFSESDMNLTNFREAAEIVYDEGLGFSLVIDQVQKASDLIDTIEQHIDGYIGPNPITGEIEVILARQDYVAADEFQADETNIIEISKYSRGEYNQTYNEVRVQYTDRDKDYKDNYAPAQDLANLIIQGRPRSKTMRYSGVHTADVANKIVWRDIKQLAVALATATIEMDRTAWNLQPGKVVVVTDEEVQISDVPFRIIQIRQGDPLKASILLDIVEDVFGNEVVAFTDPPDTEFIPPTTDAFALATAQQLAMEAPYIINVNDVLQPNRFPRLYVAARSQDNVLRFEVNVDQTAASSPSGFDVFEPDLGGISVIVGSLLETLTAWQDGNGTFTIDVTPLSGDLGEIVGEQAPGGIGALTGVCVISPGTATEEWLITDEIVFLAESPEIGSVQLRNVYRTGLDSAMHDHSIGAEIWFIWTGSAGMILNEQWALSNTLDVKLLSITQTDRVNLDDSPEPPSAFPVVIDADARYNKPLLPFELNFDNYGNFPVTSESPESFIDFDLGYTNLTDITSPLTVYQGARVIPSPRLFRNGNVIWQVTGLDAANASFDAAQMVADKMRISWWIYDLDATPSATRGVDEYDSAEDVPWLTPNDEIALLKSKVPTAGRVNNVFNARLEIEVSHSPFDVQPTSPEAYVFSREIMYFDFVVTAIFIVPDEAVMFYTRFDGDNLASELYDIGFYGTDQEAVPVGEAHVRVDQSVFGGSSGYMPDEPTGYAGLNVAGWHFPGPLPQDSPSTILDWNNNWTIEFRWRSDFDLFSSDSTFFTQSSINSQFGADADAVDRIRLFYDESAQRMDFEYRRDNDTTINLSLMPNNVFVASEDTWYAIAVSKKNISPGVWQISVFVDGVLHDTTATQTNVFKDYYEADFVIGYNPNAGLGNSNSVRGWMDEFRITMGFGLYSVDYVLPENKSPATIHLDGDQFSTVHQKIALLASFNPRDGKGGLAEQSIGQMTWHAGGTSSIEKHNPFNGSPDGEGPFWSLRCDGVDSEAENTADGAYLEDMGSTDIYRQFDLLAEDWTMEVWMKERIAAEGDGTALIARYNRPSGNRVTWYWWITADYQIVFSWSPIVSISNTVNYTSTGLPTTSPASDAIPINVWHHHVVERFNDDVYMYVDGLLIGYEQDLFLDGSAPNGNEISNPTDQPLSIGRFFDTFDTPRSRSLDGWITEPRITVGEAVYASQFSQSPPPFTGSPPVFSSSPEFSFTVPTEAFTVTERTKFRGVRTKEYDPDSQTDMQFLTHWIGGPGSPLIEPVDESPNARVITLQGGAMLDTLTPFPDSVQASGSLRVSGTASPVPGASIPDDPVWEIDAEDFCLETHVMFASLPTGSPDSIAHLFGQWVLSSNDLVFRLAFDGDRGLLLQLSLSGTALTVSEWFVPFEPVVGPSPESWYHVVCSRKGNQVYFFIDGVYSEPEENGDFTLTNAATNGAVTFGYGLDNSVLPDDILDGWLAETRITIGHYVYEPEDFTPRTEPFDHHLTAFMPGPDRRVGYDSGMFDYSFLKAVSSSTQFGAQWTADNPFFTKPSPDDGVNPFYPQSYTAESNGDAITYGYEAGMGLLDGPFTIESWARINDLNQNNMAGHWVGSTQQSWTLWFRSHADGRIRFDYTTDGTQGTAVSISYNWPDSPRINNWFHVAVVRDNTVSPERIRMYIDGIELSVESSPDISLIDPSVSLYDPVGNFITFAATTDGDSNEWDGFMEEFRVIKKVMYSGNFTPPTERLPRY